MESLLPANSWKRIEAAAASCGADEDEATSLARLLPDPKADKVVQITQYERIDFDFAGTHPATSLVNSYMIRKALIRKHFLSATVDTWVAKHPGSVLKTHAKRSEPFEVDYAEFLDDALVEAFDLRASLERNEAAGAGAGGEGGHGGKTEWWILKPSMSDRGQGIRLFSTMEQLQDIFDGWEEELSDSEDEEEDEEQDQDEEEEEGKQYIRTSHLRHFVAQPYIDRPLLLAQTGRRKFHVRTYVLALGGLRVYVYRDMLALFAARPYTPPSSSSSSTADTSGGGAGEIDLDAHLTNTCLQGSLDDADAAATKEDSVHRFWDLGAAMAQAGVDAEDVFAQICAVTAEVFEAAAREMVIHFQPMENAFEVFGLDFLVDEGGTAWLLEVNAFPDFKQTGRLSGVVEGFWRGVVEEAVVPFATGAATGAAVAVGEKEGKKGDEEMVLVREVDLGRGRGW